MPRTTTVETPGCPALRALTLDVLGLLKVVESSGGENGGAAKVVERWGIPDSSKSVLAASILGRETDPLLGVARKCGSIEVIGAINGDLRVHIPALDQENSPENDSVVGLHLFKKHQSTILDRSCMLLTCTTKGHSRIESIETKGSATDFTRGSTKTWNVSGSGDVLFSKVDENERFVLYGGKGVEVNMWDLNECSKIWTAKSPPKNNLGIFTPPWFTSGTFLSKDDHRKFVAGINSHQVRLYDISAQRRPVMAIDFRETPIKAVAHDSNGHTIYVGNGSGDLGSIDMRTGKLLGCFIGKCSGSIRSIAKHPDLPVVASCGLDSYLRIWDVHSRQLLSAVFLKQHLTNVFFDSNHRNKAVTAQEPLGISNDDPSVEEDSVRPKRKKSSQEHHRSKKVKSTKGSKRSKE